MDRNKVLEHITKGLQAASKIQKVYNSSLRSNSNTSVRAGNKSMLADIIGIIAEHSPDTHKRTLEEALSRSYQYSEAYSHIKQHLRTVRNQKMNKENFIETLNVVRPILSNRRKALVDKVMKIFEIINS